MMVRERECKCIGNAIRATKLATRLEQSALIHIHTGTDIRFRSTASIMPPQGIRFLTDLINRDADDLDQELIELEKNCDLQLDMELSGQYSTGKTALEETRKSKGRNLSAAGISGNRINSVLQDDSFTKKLISCKD